MREILFRGKRIDNGDWVEGNYFIEEQDIEDGIIWRDVPVIQQQYGDHFNCFEIDPATVGQYAVVDKNGRKIFEGDCIKVVIKKYGYDGMTETETTQKGLVAYDSIGMIGLVLEVRDGRNLWSDCFLELSMLDSIIDYRFEVIGNIHDNPELLR